MTDAQCRAADWYALGERDALIYALRPQIEQYAYQCEKFGVQPAEKAYLDGWNDGNGERQRRSSAGMGGT